MAEAEVSSNPIEFKNQEFNEIDEENLNKQINRFFVNESTKSSLRKARYLAKNNQDREQKYKVELEEKKQEIGELSEKIVKLKDIKKKLEKELIETKEKLKKFETENVPKSTINPVPPVSHSYTIANCNINHQAVSERTDAVDYKLKYEQAIKDIKAKDRKIIQLEAKNEQLKLENSNYSNEIRTLKSLIQDLESSELYIESGS